jgi:hypothetical protein
MDKNMHFIVEILDNRHLFIDPAQYDRVQSELRKRLAQNVYVAPEHRHPPGSEASNKH